MSLYAVEKQFYQKINTPGLPAPTVNKYAEECQKKHMPEKVMVIGKKNLVKAVELALGKGGDVSKNEAILKLNEEVQVSTLNQNNFCCISHRFATCSNSIAQFTSLFHKFLASGYFCGEDVCYEERNHFDTFSKLWAFVSKIVSLVFKEDDENATNFMNYLGNNVGVLGLVDSSKASSEDDIDGLQEVKLLLF